MRSPLLHQCLFRDFIVGNGGNGNSFLNELYSLFPVKCIDLCISVKLIPRIIDLNFKYILIYKKL